ncbi:MAG TPA: CHAT domain-containing protein [Pyrinomonadaceae bacterium]|jgi:CHAT domain-containing protein/Tfp pilus assembly protein PilF|nr:CHAT domain-containing protein [Pyrinomonadaceae bacterium]
MKQQFDDQRFIKDYLLGEVSEEDRQREFEQRLLTEDSFFEELLMAEDELIDDYLSGALSEEEQGRFENHFLSTTERQRKLRFARALRRHVSNRAAAAEEAPGPASSLYSRWLAWTKGFFSSPMKLAVAALLLLALGLGVWRAFIYQSDVSQGLLALKNAYREQRPTETRITGFDYAPLAQTRGDEPARVDADARARAERYLLDAARDQPGAASYHALGRFYLAELKFDRAIEQFNKALATDENNPQLQSDLGAALLEKGKLDRLNREAGKSFEELAESLGHLNRAIELNGSLLEAIFNRALCHQYMLLPQQAAADWRTYLERDPDSEWAAEARRNLKVIESQTNKVSQNKGQILQDFLSAYRARDDDAAWQLISLNRDLTGSLVENALLDSYLETKARGRAIEARENLQALSYAAGLELSRADDRFLSDLLRFYQSTPAAHHSSLIEARRFMALGRQGLQLFKPEEAVEYYSKARRIFDRIGNECESAYAEYPLGHAYLLMHKSELSLSIFQRVARGSEANQYKWLLAQALNAIGNVQIGLNDYSTALDHSHRSWEISERINDVGGLMKTADQLTIEYTRLGNYRKAIEQQQRSLALFSRVSPEPLQLWRSYFLMAAPLNLLGLNAAAAAFQKEALRVAIEARMPYSICRSYISLGLIYGSQRDYEEATRNVRMAFELAKDIPSAATRADTVGYSALQLGHLYRQSGDFGKAIASYEQAIQIYGGLNYSAFSYAAHKGKLLSCMAAQEGGCSSVEQELETTLSLFEHYRSKILEESNRDSFFDTEQNLYDVAIDYQYSIRHDFQTAFELSERSRARSLLDMTSTKTRAVDTNDAHDIGFTTVSQPMGLAEIQQQMPEQAQILQYSVLDNKLLIWLLTRTGISNYEQNITLAELRRKVSNYLRLVSRPLENMDELSRASADLYDLLIGPVESALDRNKQLCIVPDKVLNYLPYSALLSRSSAKYLTQSYTLTFAPSSNIFIVCSRNARRKEGNNPERLLSVGNPSFDHRAFPALVDLPAAEREVEGIAAYYNSPPVITGDRAIKRRVKNEMERADVIHLALHSVVDEQSPLHSKLLLASVSSSSSTEGPSAEDGILQAYEIYRLRLPQTRLVVLSACQTGAERYYGGEGMISISRPFIAVGVPLVVASLWPVDSGATGELMVDFHKHRKWDGLSTADALRSAQQDMLDHPEERYRHPYYWASFIAIGGYARF